MMMYRWVILQTKYVELKIRREYILYILVKKINQISYKRGGQPSREWKVLYLTHLIVF